MIYKINQNFLPVRKKLSYETEKNEIFVYPGLRYADKKIKFASKNFFG